MLQKILLAPEPDAVLAAWRRQALEENSLTGCVELALYLARTGRRDDSIDFLCSAEPRFQTRAAFYRNFGRIQHFSGLPLPARRSLLKAVALDPAQPLWVYYLLGKARYSAIFITHEVAYLPIPKNAAAPMKEHILQYRIGSVHKNPQALFENPFLATRDIAARLRATPYVFAILRHPVERLVDYYRENIIERQSLTSELGVFAATAYGLPTLPDFRCFVENLRQYALCYDDVLHHLLPQSAYLAEPDIASAVYTAGQLEEIRCDIEQFSGVGRQRGKEQAVLPDRRHAGGPVPSVDADLYAMITGIYADDLRLVSHGMEARNARDERFFQPLTAWAS